MPFYSQLIIRCNAAKNRLGGEIDVGAGNFLKVRRIFCLNFPKLPETFHLTNFLHTDFLQLLMHFILLYNVAIDLKI